MNPYDQIDGETDEEYVKFLAFKDLGLSRSVSKAEAYVTGRPKKAQPSGSWKTACKKNKWHERCSEYDRSLAVKMSESKEAKRERAQGYMDTCLEEATRTMSEIWTTKDLKSIPLQLQKFGLQIGREKGVEAMERINKILNPQKEQPASQTAIVLNFNGEDE